MKEANVFFFITGLIFLLRDVKTQSYNQLRSEIPSFLLECYRYPELLSRENLLPMTTNVFIALIRKIERFQGSNLDARTSALALLHKFKLDGIERQPNVEHTEYIIPYATKQAQFFRQKLLLENFLPSRYEVILENLDLVERCSLHWMLSNSVDPWERGDETYTCNRLSTSVYEQRVRRSASEPNPQWDRDRQYSQQYNQQYNQQYSQQYDQYGNNNPDLSQSPNQWDSQYQNGQLRQSQTRDSFSPVNSFSQKSPYDNTFGQAALSTCPTENGVVFNKLGVIKMGTVIAGIAAGLQPQNVSVSNVLRSRENFSGRDTLNQRPITHRRVQQSTFGLVVDNRWAATVAGEVALLALTKSPSLVASTRIGLTGGWNDTCLPKWYFLREAYHETITDAEIRGAVDGIILSYKMSDASNIDNTIKLSQILDMYYSDQGLFDAEVQASRRSNLYANLVPINYAQEQAFHYALTLNPQIPSTFSIADNSVINSATQSVLSNFNSHVGSMMNSRPREQNYRAAGRTESAAELFIVLDFMWDFRDSRRIIGYLIDQLDISRYSGRFSVVNAKEGSIMINSTDSILEFHLNFTELAYRTQPTGYDLHRTLQQLRQYFKWRMDLDRISNSGGGPSFVVLFIPHVTSVIYDKDRDYLWSMFEDFRRYIPDVYFLTTGTKDRSSLSLFDDYKDVFTLSINDLGASVDTVVNRINDIPRRLINPACGANWYDQSWSVRRNNFFNYVGLNSIQYFRLHPNYFFGSDSFRIKIQGFGYGMLSICHSRTNEKPNANGTYLNDISCRQINTDFHVIEIHEPCSDYDYATHCPPLYISIATGRPGLRQNFRCNDDNCRNPAMVKYSITAEGLSCHSSAIRTVSSTLLMSVLPLLIIFFSKP